MSNLGDIMLVETFIFYESLFCFGVKGVVCLFAAFNLSKS